MSKQTSFLPFSNYNQLYQKCKEVVAIMDEYQTRNKERLTENGVKFVPMDFGVMISLDDLSKEQVEKIKDENWEGFTKMFCEKYNITGDLQSLNI